MELRKIFWILDTKNSRATIAKWCEKAKPNSSAGLKLDADFLIDYVEKYYKETSDQLAAAYWFCNADDLTKLHKKTVDQALYICKQKKLDPLKQDPLELVKQYPDVKPKEKPINPDDVLTDKKDEGDGIVSYAARNEDREVLRQILNTHYGKDSSPWCLLQGDANGELTYDSRRMWEHYDAYPKRVAFRNGRLLSFSAGRNPSVREWWDRYDRSFPFIPFEGKTWVGRDGATYSIGKQGNVFVERGNYRGRLSRDYSTNIEGSDVEASIDRDSHIIEIDGYEYSYVEDGDGYKVSGGGVTARVDQNLDWDGPYRKEAGDRVSIFNYVHGKREGNAELYRSGQLAEKCTYKNDKREGSFESYYYNGQLTRKCTYKNGKLEGPFETYSKDGQLRLKGAYDENGDRSGSFESYYEDGQLEEKCTYKGNLKVGPYESYHPNGQLRMKCTYKNDDYDGPYESYRRDGTLKVKCTYKDGKLVGPYESHYENGQLAEKYTQDESGNLSGLYEYYYDNGQLRSKCTYKDGIRIGPSETYYENGQLKEKYTQDESGNLSGLYEHYYDNGQLKEKCTYKNDHRVGLYERYYEDGRLYSKTIYNDVGAVIG